MKTIKMTVEFTYDDESMHGDDTVAEDWFFNDILGGNDLILMDRGDLGDDLGDIKILGFLQT
tara:strand:+ start:59 stop:244 length:186 start_codon:yes stop_codon:yes gene_type:complete